MNLLMSICSTALAAVVSFLAVQIAAQSTKVGVHFSHQQEAYQELFHAAQQFELDPSLNQDLKGLFQDGTPFAVQQSVHPFSPFLQKIILTLSWEENRQPYSLTINHAIIPE